MVTSPKTFCWPVSVLNFACKEILNFKESCCISLFAMTTQIILLSGSDWKNVLSSQIKKREKILGCSADKQQFCNS